MARFLVTGGAGFIGSNIVRSLLNDGHEVRVLDDFSTGRHTNIEDLKEDIEVFEGSICDDDLLKTVFEGIEYCLHQAAIPSVPLSVEKPRETNRVNVEGTIKVFLAARDAGIRRVVFASSSSVYGNVEKMPVREDIPVNPISPYAVNKATDEMYAKVFSDLYDMDIVALRYFNVFGPFQDPKSAYAAVVPIFVRKMLAGQRPQIFGDGLQSRDFSYVDNVVSANVMAVTYEKDIAGAYNIACGYTTNLIKLVDYLNQALGTEIEADFLPERKGDIKHSFADISKAKQTFGYQPKVLIDEGIRKTAEWYKNSSQCED